MSDLGLGALSRDRLIARIAALEAALRDYHFALDSRKNGDVAADNLRRRIEEILGMPWEQGVEMKRRAAEKGDRDA